MECFSDSSAERPSVIESGTFTCSSLLQQSIALSIQENSKCFPLCFRKEQTSSLRDVFLLSRIQHCLRGHLSTIPDLQHIGPPRLKNEDDCKSSDEPVWTTDSNKYLSRWRSLRALQRFSDSTEYLGSHRPLSLSQNNTSQAPLYLQLKSCRNRRTVANTAFKLNLLVLLKKEKERKRKKEKDMHSKQDEVSDSKEENYARQVEATGAVLTGFSPSSYFTYGPLKPAVPVDQDLKCKLFKKRWFNLLNNV
ncbi:PREDICTED: uncharacterized protein LOC106900974 [Calidris pugnax]|uniref:uncharacterized protein LOC106900974 n=1 Tax=Calidris pugnax TaxID=198806 RepID=UPI00071D1AD0|nr:PREDICTED: uncharacterized protein LOC106900974 [Calidris pugnax]